MSLQGTSQESKPWIDALFVYALETWQVQGDGFSLEVLQLTTVMVHLCVCCYSIKKYDPLSG